MKDELYVRRVKFRSMMIGKCSFFVNDFILKISIRFSRRARSTTPTRGPFILNPDRERLLLSLAQSEADIAQITKQLSDVKDTLARLKLVRRKMFQHNSNEKETLIVVIRLFLFITMRTTNE